MKSQLGWVSRLLKALATIVIVSGVLSIVVAPLIEAGYRVYAISH